MATDSPIPSDADLDAVAAQVRLDTPARLPKETTLLRKAARLVGKVPFVRDIVAAYYAVMDPATPVRARLVLTTAIAYFVLPIDLIPDFLPMLGFTDDMAVLAMAVKTVADAVKGQHYDRADAALQGTAKAAKEDADKAAQA